MMKPSNRARAALALGSLLVALGAAEVFARVFFPFFQTRTLPAALDDHRFCDRPWQFDPDTGWWPRSNLDCVMPAERSVLLRTNSAGIRATRDFGLKAPGVFRVGVFGDSFTFGALVTAEETYAAILEAGVPGVEMVNFGLAGGGPDQSLLALRYKGASLGLDALIVAPTA